MKTAPKRHSPLNARQERFCELIVSGTTAKEAYRLAGYTGEGNVAESTASKLLRNPKVQARMAGLRATQTSAALLTRDEKRRILARMVTDPATPVLAKIRAIELDSKLAGHFEPERVTVEAGPVTLESIRQRAIGVASALAR